MDHQGAALSDRLWHNLALSILVGGLVVAALAQGRHLDDMQRVIRRTPAVVDAHLSPPDPRRLREGHGRDQVVRSYAADVWSGHPDFLWVVQDLALRRRPGAARASSLGDSEDLMRDLTEARVDMLILGGIAMRVEPLDRKEADEQETISPLRGDATELRYFTTSEGEAFRAVPRRPAGRRALVLCCRLRPSRPLGSLGSPLDEDPVRIFPMDLALPDALPAVNAAPPSQQGSQGNRRMRRAPRRAHVIAYNAAAR